MAVLPHQARQRHIRRSCGCRVLPVLRRAKSSYLYARSLHRARIGQCQGPISYGSTSANFALLTIPQNDAVRKYILENDLLEAIIALPNDIFYNTGIATYIWVLSNKKAGTKREGKVQLINANGLYEKRSKALGNKRNDISESAIAEITQIYVHLPLS